MAIEILLVLALSLSLYSKQFYPISCWGERHAVIVIRGWKEKCATCDVSYTPEKKVDSCIEYIFVMLYDSTSIGIYFHFRFVGHKTVSIESLSLSILVQL